MPVMKDIMAMQGVFTCEIHNCMYGSERRKWTRFLTNIPELAHWLNQLCENEEVCSSSGKPHKSFTPPVNDKGDVTSFPTEPEAEYPPGMAQAIASGIVEYLERRHAEGLLNPCCVWDFTEVFSGPRAPLTHAMSLELLGRGVKAQRSEKA